MAELKTLLFTLIAIMSGKIICINKNLLLSIDSKYQVLLENNGIFLVLAFIVTQY